MATFIIWGDNGLLRQHELRHELSEANEDLRELQRANQSLLRYLRAMEQDPVVMERVAAEELGMSTSGARIYRFATDEDLPRKRPQ